MEDVRNSYGFVLEQNYVGESVNHHCPKLRMDAAKGIGSIGNRFNTITNRIPKTIAEVNGNVVEIRDCGSDVVRNKEVITPSPSHRRAGKEMLENASAKIRHMIVLSDGQTQSADHCQGATG